MIAKALLPLLLASCASSGPAVHGDDARIAAPHPESGSGTVQKALLAQLDRWRGTRYRFGGTGRRGFDCSGLVYVVYRDAFDRTLPRTTARQQDLGDPVDIDTLVAGDLVFFKTGTRQRHVGIYLNDGMFFHASRSDGVRLSSLDSAYWRERFWKARRPVTRQAGI